MLFKTLIPSRLFVFANLLTMFAYQIGASCAYISDALVRYPFLNETPLREVIATDTYLKSDNNWITLVRGAILEYDVKNYSTAETQLLSALNIDIPTEIKKAAIQCLCHIYSILGNAAREILMYERYFELFDDVGNIPYVTFKLCSLYSESGAHEVAINRYYSVLNRALIVPTELFEEYRCAIVYAQIKIADAYTKVGNFQKALELLDKIQAELIPENQTSQVLFMKGQCAYETKRFADAVSILETFREKHLDDINAPKCCYMLVQCYKSLQNFDKVTQIAQFILNEGKIRRNANNDVGRAWNLWQKKTAEEVANDFYEKNEFADALKIYQIMVQMDSSIEWQWPLLYNIGLCYERMQMLDRSRAAYELIAESKEDPSLPSILSDYKKEASWKIKQLNLIEQNKLQSISL